MKRGVAGILFGVMFLIGLGIFLYPMISNQKNVSYQNEMITGYEETVDEMETEDFSKEWELARAFNDKLEENSIYADVFDTGEENLNNTEYWEVLNMNGDGIMGYLTIPKIDLKLSIYHGTEESVLQTGIGHLNGSKLPIGGESNHSILAAHRGLPSAKLFTDIDQLKRGDMFYIHILDETFAYQVDRILDMVPQDDMKTLEEAMAITEGEDQVTLFTCTPYGINSHRLLVRGIRVPYEGEEKAEADVPETMVQSIQNYDRIYVVLGVSAGFLILVIGKGVIRRKKRRRK